MFVNISAAQGTRPQHRTPAGRAEAADALAVDGGPEVVWLGAAVIIGAGSTSFEMVRYVGDRLLLIPLPPWADYHRDPISIRDVLHYLLAAGDADRVTAGAYDLVGTGSTTYRGLLAPTYGRPVRCGRLCRCPIGSRDCCRRPWWPGWPG